MAAAAPGAESTVGGLGGSVVIALGSTGGVAVCSPPRAASAKFGAKCAAWLGGTCVVPQVRLSRSTFAGCRGSTKPGKPGGLSIHPVAGGQGAAAKEAASVAAPVGVTTWMSNL